MFTLGELYGYVKTAVPGIAYLPNAWTTNADDTAALVRMTGGYPPSEWTTQKRPSFQFIVRSSNWLTAEAKANELHAHFHRRTEFTIGTTRVIACTADQSVPLYIGVDENNRAMYSVNFTCVTAT